MKQPTNIQYSYLILCDICHETITDIFVDGKTKMGPWAEMCSTCYKEHGTGLGLGKGQLYVIATPNGESAEELQARVRKFLGQPRLDVQA